MLSSGLLQGPRYYLLLSTASLETQKVRDRAGTFPGNHSRAPPSAHRHIPSHSGADSQRQSTAVHRDPNGQVTGFDVHPGKEPNRGHHTVAHPATTQPPHKPIQPGSHTQTIVFCQGSQGPPACLCHPHPTPAPHTKEDRTEGWLAEGPAPGDWH